MTSIEERHIEDMESQVRQRSAYDVLADQYGLETRSERRAFKANMKRLVRKEARKKKRSKK